MQSSLERGFQKDRNVSVSYKPLQTSGRKYLPDVVISTTTKEEYSKQDTENTPKIDLKSEEKDKGE